MVLPLLFLLADTGGGQRSAARAVGEALDAAYPGRFDPVLCDPLADRPVAESVAAHEPAAIVSFHPLTGGAAARARRREHRDVPVPTVVTDLTTVHAAWRLGLADRWVATGLPVTSGF